MTRPLWTVALSNWAKHYQLCRDDVVIAQGSDMRLLLGMADALNSGGQESAAQSAIAVLAMSLGNPVIDDRGITREEAVVRYALAKIADLTRQCEGMDAIRDSVQGIHAKQAALTSMVETAGAIIEAKDKALAQLERMTQGDAMKIAYAGWMFGQPYGE